MVAWDGIRPRCKYCAVYVEEMSLKRANEMSEINSKTQNMCAFELRSVNARELRKHLKHIFVRFYVWFYKLSDGREVCNYCYKKCIRNKLDIDVISIAPYEYDKRKCNCLECKSVISVNDSDYKPDYFDKHSKYN